MFSAIAAIARQTDPSWKPPQLETAAWRMNTCGGCLNRLVNRLQVIVGTKVKVLGGSRVSIFSTGHCRSVTRSLEVICHYTACREPGPCQVAELVAFYAEIFNDAGSLLARHLENHRPDGWAGHIDAARICLVERLVADRDDRPYGVGQYLLRSVISKIRGAHRHEAGENLNLGVLTAIRYMFVHKITVAACLARPKHLERNSVQHDAWLFERAESLLQASGFLEVGHTGFFVLALQDTE